MLAMLMRYGDNKKAYLACTKQHTIRIKLMFATFHRPGDCSSRQMSQFLCQAADPLNVAVRNGIAVLSCKKLEISKQKSGLVRRKCQNLDKNVRGSVNEAIDIMFSASLAPFCVASFFGSRARDENFYWKCLFLCSLRCSVVCLWK